MKISSSLESACLTHAYAYIVTCAPLCSCSKHTSPDAPFGVRLFESRADECRQINLQYLPCPCSVSRVKSAHVVDMLFFSFAFNS